MKNIIYIILSLLCIPIITSCDNNDLLEDPSDYLVFGRFYGECEGEGCVEMFKLTDEGLYEDTLDMSDFGFWGGEFNVLIDDEKFQQVKDLGDYFPFGLLLINETVLGQPDAGDWGGIYFEMKSGSVHRFWLLDQNESNMSQQYNEFVDKINEKISIINQ